MYATYKEINNDKKKIGAFIEMLVAGNNFGLIIKFLYLFVFCKQEL